MIQIELVYTNSSNVHIHAFCSCCYARPEKLLLIRFGSDLAKRLNVFLCEECASKTGELIQGNTMYYFKNRG